MNLNLPNIVNKALNGDIEAVIAEIDGGTDINTVDAFYGWTCLHAAAMTNNFGLLAVLVRYNCINFQIVDRFHQKTPQSLAYLFGNYEMGTALIRLERSKMKPACEPSC